MYPISKYKFYVTPDETRVFAVSTYAGKTVKGVAKKDPRDTFDMAFGKELAAARCAAKVAKKRKVRAAKQVAKAAAEFNRAYKYFEKMKAYQADANEEFEHAICHKIKLETSGK